MSGTIVVEPIVMVPLFVTVPLMIPKALSKIVGWGPACGMKMSCPATGTPEVVQFAALFQSFGSPATVLVQVFSPTTGIMNWPEAFPNPSPTPPVMKSSPTAVSVIVSDASSALTQRTLRP